MVEAVHRIAASILAADFGRLADEACAARDAGADWIHVDVMDGHFVPNLTIGPQAVEALRRAVDLPLDVHLMIEQPEKYVDAFTDAGAGYISVHQEACPHLHAVVQQIRERGARPAVVLNPATPLASLEMILADVDMVLIMSVNPGFGGQKFIPSALDKVAAARRLRAERGLDLLIEVDGGLKTHNVAPVAAAGADVFVVGTGLFATDDYGRTITELRRAVEEGATSSAA